MAEEQELLLAVIKERDELKSQNERLWAVIQKQKEIIAQLKENRDHSSEIGQSFSNATAEDRRTSMPEQKRPLPPSLVPPRGISEEVAKVEVPKLTAGHKSSKERLTGESPVQPSPGDGKSKTNTPTNGSLPDNAKADAPARVSKVIKHGILYKKGNYFGGWKTRYYSLDTSGKLYYADSAQSEVLGHIPLSNSYVVPYYPGKKGEVDKAGLVLVEYKKSFFSGPISLSNMTADGLPVGKVENRHVLFAETTEDRDAWVLQISTVICQCRPQDELATVLMSNSNATPVPPVPGKMIPTKRQSSLGLRKPSSSEGIINQESAEWEKVDIAKVQGAIARARPDSIASSEVHDENDQSTPKLGRKSNADIQAASNIESNMEARHSGVINPGEYQRHGTPERNMSMNESPLGPKASITSINQEYRNGTGLESRHTAIFSEQRRDSFGKKSERRESFTDSRRNSTGILPEERRGSAGKIPERRESTGKAHESKANERQTAAHTSHEPRQSVDSRVNDQRISLAQKNSTSAKSGRLDDDQHRCANQPLPLFIYEELPLSEHMPDGKSSKSKQNKLTDWLKRKNSDSKHTLFGVTINEAVDCSRIQPNYEIPALMYRCIEYLDAKNASSEEGIYRLSGSSAVINSLKQRFEQEGDVNLLSYTEYLDPHAVAGLLKQFLRELAEPLFTAELRMELFRIADIPQRENKIQELSKLVEKLPLVNYTCLKCTLGHLLRITQQSDINKMTVRNIAIVFSPTLGIPAGLFTILLADFSIIFYQPIIDRGSRPLPTPAQTQHTSQPNSKRNSVERLDRFEPPTNPASSSNRTSELPFQIPKRVSSQPQAVAPPNDDFSSDIMQALADQLKQLDEEENR